MFFSKKKEKTEQKEEIPVVIKKPPPLPKRRIFNVGGPNENATEAAPVPNERTTSVQNGISFNGVSQQAPNEHSALSSGESNGLEVTAPASSASAAFGMLKDFGLSAELRLPALQAVQIDNRPITLTRNNTGDFGFSVRRVQMAGGGGAQRTVVFAEPTQLRQGPPRPDDLKNGLLPGDQLVEVNGRRVETLNRDELQNEIRNSGDTIALVVRAVPELAELCCRGGARGAGDQLLLPNVHTNAQQAIPEDERYWLVHKDGYTAARLLETLPDGRVRIDVAGQELVVDGTDVDRANPAWLDKTGDLARLKHLNETAVVHLIRQRMGSNLSYTLAGSACTVCVSTDGEETMCLSGDRLVDLFRGARRRHMPAHIYTAAQNLYRHVQMSGQSQSLVLSGVSGAGKSTQMRAVARFLCAVAGWAKHMPFERVSCALGVVEGLTHAATSLHRDSTRCALLLHLGFDRAAAIRSARVECSLLESERVWRRPEGEATFHVFHWMMQGASEETRQRLGLHLLPQLLPVTAREEAQEAWQRFVAALSSFGFCSDQLTGVENALAAILHLRYADATPAPATKAHFLRADHAAWAARLLCVGVDDLAAAAFRGKTAGPAPTLPAHGGTTQSPIKNISSRFAMANRGADGVEALAAFSAQLYEETLAAILVAINRALAHPTTTTTITMLDLPGGSMSSGWMAPGRTSGLSDLVFNYANERVSELFHDATFTDPLEVYSREQVEVSVEPAAGSPHPLTRLIDTKTQLASSVDVSRRAAEERGLLSLLEEESLFPGASDHSLLERIFVHLGHNTRLIRRGARPLQLVVSHGVGCLETTYSVEGWCRQAAPSDVRHAVRPLLAAANGPIHCLFAVSAAEATAAVRRRATQVAHMDSRRTAGFAANLHYQIDSLLHSVRRSPRIHFVHCIHSGSGMRVSGAPVGGASDLDVPFVRNQLRGMLLVDAVRANNSGYPERVSFRDFRRRFGCLVEGEGGVDPSDNIDDRAAVAHIMQHMDVAPHRYRLGISQLLLRSDVLLELEERRDGDLAGLIVSFQRECRRHLAARWLHRRRVLETAVRCVQKNGKSYLTVREWPWWKLYTRVVPLLAVNRQDTENREWVEKVRALEQQLADMKAGKEKAERREEELSEALMRESQSGVELAAALEREAQQRTQVERRLIREEEALSRRASSARLEGAVDTATGAAADEQSGVRAEVERARQSEEQTRVAAKKTLAELADTRRELEDIAARNQILEKKQARFDAELMSVQSAVAEEREKRQLVEREREEREQAVQRRAGEVAETRAEVAELRAQLARARREADEAAHGAGQHDLATLRKERRELQTRVAEQEEELDEQAGQLHMAKQNVTRLEMEKERARSDASREESAREEEMHEIRAQYHRRLRVFEEQLSDAQEANVSLHRQCRALEQRNTHSHGSESYALHSGGHYKRELRKALALLADTQTVLQHERDAAPSQALLRQLREQLEDAEAARLSVQKGKHGLEGELNELRALLEQTMAGKKVAEDKVLSLLREKNSGVALIEEKDEQLQAVMRKYKQAVQQHSIDTIQIAEYLEQLADSEKKQQKLTEQLNERSTQLEFLQHHTVEKHRLTLAEQKHRELEAKLDLEIMQKQRLESMLVKLRDEVDSLHEQLSEACVGRDREMEGQRKARKETTALADMLEQAKKRDAEYTHKHKSHREEVDRLEEQVRVLSSEVKVCHRRIDELQCALAEGLGESEGETDVEEEMEQMEHDAREKELRCDDDTNGMNVL